MRISTKLVACILVVSQSRLSITYAYTPTSGDQATVVQLQTTLDTIIADDAHKLRNLHKQLSLLTDRFDAHDYERLHYLLSALDEHLLDTLDIRQAQARETAQPARFAFFDTYKDAITSFDLELHAPCVERYELLDDLAFVYNHPTPLLIATRYRETTCGYYLPNNTRGPFQIISRDYGTGDITHTGFVQAVEDYLAFADYKYDRYARANSQSELTVDLSYTSWSYTGVIQHAALYNGLSGANIRGDIRPAAPSYLRDNYTQEYSGALRDGVMATMLKVVQRELQHK